MSQVIFILYRKHTCKNTSPGLFSFVKVMSFLFNTLFVNFDADLTIVGDTDSKWHVEVLVIFVNLSEDSGSFAQSSAGHQGSKVKTTDSSGCIAA